ncbi:MAG: tyrosine-type recombinase/integrase [Intestinibacter sp.]|uniref:tyrosine-type recombinase/integrase n=1 Tax=Intestinibacter sp. TaxID=1965304 RepID=UPI0025C17374|nr:tyrosine-type recombinase/integrase [Intestinibacter sp.]MCI6737451.1 tyrosine-type recombinase/integrase [Intestinibacter sp.]
MKVLREYLDYIEKSKKLSKNTVASYNRDLKKYLDYLNSNNIDISDVVENDIISYLIELEKDEVSVSSISRMISSIKSYHDYLFFNKLTDTDPSKNIKKPKVKRDQVEILTEEEVDKLLKFEDLSTPKKIRDKAIFEVLYGTGIKVSELIQMNLEDVDLDIDYIYCGSGKNQRVIPLCETTKLYLSKYISDSRESFASEDEKALFVNTQGQRFTRQGLWKVIKKYAQKADIRKNINPTTLRHSFAIHLLNGGANVAVVSKILGNSNLSSLQLYLKYIDKNLRKEIKEKHPRRDEIK